MNISNISAELNWTCEDIRVHGRQVLSDDVETVLRYIVLGYYCILFPFSITLTSLVIFLIIKFKHLQHTTFMLALQVVMLDWLFSLTLTPVAVISTISGTFILGSNMCIASGGEFGLIFQLRNWLMFVFVCDRFCNVFIPFRYGRNRNRVILTLWLIIMGLALIGGLLPIILGCYGFNRGVWICISAIIESCPYYEFCQAHIIAVIAIGQIAGSYTPLVMYIALFIKAKRVRNQILPASTPEGSEQRKRDRKANLTFFALFLSLFGVNFPPLLVYVILEVILPPLEVSPPEAMLLISFLLQELYALLPIMDSIAILRNHEMRKAIKTLKNRLKNRQTG